MKKRNFSKSSFFLPITLLLSATMFIPLFISQGPSVIVTPQTQNANKLSVVEKTTDTSITVKPIYDKNDQVNHFVTKLFEAIHFSTFEEWNGDESPIKDYVDINNVPENTKISLVPSSINALYADGSVSFVLSVNQFWDFDTDGNQLLKIETKDFSINLILKMANKPTIIVANNTYPKGLTTTEFKNYVADASDITIPSHFSKFVYIESLPTNSIVKIDWISEEDGIVEFNVIASIYYDEHSNEQRNADIPFVFPIELILTSNSETYRPATSLTSDPLTFPVDANATTIYSQIRAASDQVNYYWLSQFINLSTLPYEADLTFSGFGSSNPVTGNVAFTLKTNLFFSGTEIDPTGPTKYFSYNWTLKGKIPTTSISSIERVPRNITIDAFLAKVAPNKIVDRSALSIYVDLSSVPESANIRIGDVNKDPTSGSISFVIEINQFYNDNSVVIYGAKVYQIKLDSITETNNSAKSVESWIYYVIGAVVLVVIALTVFVTIKIRDRNNDKFFEFEKFEKEADKSDFDRIDSDKSAAK